MVLVQTISRGKPTEESRISSIASSLSKVNPSEKTQQDNVRLVTGRHVIISADGYMKQIIWAVAITLLFCVLGVIGDNIWGTNDPAWNMVESVINFPSTLVLKLTGPGHGFRQLVLPFFFSLVFYFVFFWVLVTVFKSQVGARDSS